jgi:ubiquinone biosynthesis monooxygenase Coq7
MRVIFAAEHMQFLVHATTQGTLGQHALDGEFERPLGVLLEQFAERNALQIADIAGVLVVDLVGELGARNPHVTGIDDHNVIAQILMRSVVRLVLAFQAQCDFRGESAKCFARGINEVPVTSDFVGLGKYGVHESALGRWKRRGSVQNSTARRQSRLGTLYGSYYNVPMSARRIDFLDSLIGEIDKAIKVLTVPRRALENVAATSPAESLPERDRLESSRLMRVNHAGEVAAQALYQGQAFTARDDTIKAAMQQSAAEEADHLAWCEERLNELGGRPSVLNPFWYAGSFAIGVLAGALGDRASLGFIAETEAQVETHLGEHLERLSAHDLRSRAILERMQHDEMRHGANAASMGGSRLPLAASIVMRAVSKVMTFGAYWV